ncbi:hypothetical protein NKDENANG_02576 [Candidatus Entotheonellaceae bacterium PAL068K]
MLRALGIERLTDYQWATLERLQQGQHVCVSAPDESGRGVVRLLRSTRF